jgi:hypothetical protein
MAKTVKTTIYLSEDLKSWLELEARQRHTSEAELIRTAIRNYLNSLRPKPAGGIFDSGGAELAGHAEEYLKGFGGW